MGVVYRAHDAVSGATVAIKHLSPYMLAEMPNLLERFIREGEVLRRLNHPNIVVLLETIVEGEEHYLVMEYVDGGSLSRLLRETPQLPFNRILEIALDVVDALIRAHRLGIIHRDVKPGNVLLTKSGAARLTDFGNAHIAQSDRLTATGMILGTYAYMSPEACRGEEVDGRTDIWSLGVMLYEMVAGSLPFSEANPMRLALAIMNEPVPDLQATRPDAPVPLVDLIYRMLTKDKNQRIPTARLVGAELEILLKRDQEFATAAGQAPANRFTEWLHLTQMFPADAQGSIPLHNLPAVLTTFVGRDEEVAQARQLLTATDTRLLTLQGPGGAGKTRLALEVAHRLVDQFQHGVYFVDLAPVESIEILPQLVADAVQLRFFGHGTPWQQLLDYLQNKEMLLIVDNFEPFVAEAALLSQMIRQAPKLRLLVTSRWRLQLQGESILSVGGLPMPQEMETVEAAGNTAVDLFLICARRIRANFTPDANDVQAIAAICRLVDGLPLEIELAAGWMSTLTPAEILVEIAADFAFLETGAPDLPPRHRSARSLMDYSWQLLNEVEQRALCSLSVFRGGFTREAVQKVADAGLQTLNALVNQSLIRRLPDSGRYEMQELLRQFAAERVAERPALQEDVYTRHIFYYLGYLQEQGRQLAGEGQLHALAAIEQEVHNVRAAWRRAGQQEDVVALGTAVEALYRFYQLRGRRQEGLEMLERAAQFLRALPVRQHLVEAKLLARQGAFARFIGRREQAVSLLQESLKIARELGEKREIAFSLYHLGAADPTDAAAAAYWQESLKLAQELEDDELLAEALNWSAYTPYRQGETAEATRLLRASLDIRRAMGDRHGLAIALSNLGVIYARQGENEQAQSLLQESLRLYRPFDDLQGMAVTANNLSHAAINLQDYPLARQWAAQALAYADEVGDRRTQAVAYTNLAEIALYQGDYKEARTFCREAISLKEQLNEPAGIAYTVLGRVALAQEEQAEAGRYLSQALAEEPENLALSLEILAGIAELLAWQGQTEEAVHLLTFVLSQMAGEQVVKERVGARLAVLATSLSEEQLTAAWNEAQQFTLAEWVERLRSVPVFSDQ